MSEIPQEWVRKAADPIHRWRPYGMRVPAEELAEYVLAAVLPTVRRAVADEIATAIEAHGGDLYDAEHAARLARVVGERP